jgi:uncharacterized protein
MSETARPAVAATSPPRFSSCTVVSTRLPGGGHALLNTISGALDLVPDELGASLRAAFCDRSDGTSWMLDPVRTQGIAAALPPETLEDFIARGHVTTLPLELEQGLVRDIAAATHEVQRQRPQFMIIPTADCNYRCAYCFERPLQNGLRVPNSEIGHARRNVALTVEQIPAIFSAIATIKRSAAAPPGGQVILYGGEPLDARNAGVVSAIVARGMRDGFTFAAVTNGHDLERFFAIMGRGHIEVIQISIDGPQAVHDRRRVHIGRQSSFEAIVRNIRRALEVTDVEIQLRVHVDPDNLNGFEEVLAFFEGQGWTSNPRLVIYASTVYEKDDAGRVSARLENGEMAEMLRPLIRRHRNVFSSGPAVHGVRALFDVFENGGRFQGRGTYCAANTGNYIFAPDGQIYACWESIGKACSRIGQYSNGLTFDETARGRWFGRSVAQVPECLRCAFALVCGGGCAQYSEYNAGTLYKPYCDDFQRLYSGLLAEEVDMFVEQQSTGSDREEVHSAED